MYTCFQMWGCIPLFFVLGRQKQVGLYEFQASLPGLHNELQASRGYIVRLSQTKQTMINWRFLSERLPLYFDQTLFLTQPESVSYPAGQWFLILYYCRRIVRQ